MYRSLLPTVRPRLLPRRVFYVLLSALVCLGVSLRVANHDVPTGRSPDETVYTNQTKALLKDGTPGLRAVVAEYLRDPYVRLFPPPTRVGYLRMIGATMRLTGSDDVGVGAWLSLAASIGSLVLVALIGLRFFPDEATLFALLFFAVSPAELELARRTWGDALAGLISLSLVYIAAEITRNSQRRVLYLLFALVGSIGITIKESEPFVIAVCTAWLLWVLLFKRRDAKNGLILVAAVVIGASAGLAMLAYSVGGFATVMQIGKAWLHANATNSYALEYQSGPPSFLLESFWVISPFPTALCGFGIIAAFGQRFRPSQASEIEPLKHQVELVWFALFFLSFLVIPLVFANWLNLRYLSPIYGPFYLLAGLGLWLFTSLCRPLLAPRGASGWRKRAVSILTILLIAGMAIGALKDYQRFQRMFVEEARGDLSVKLILDYRRLGQAERVVKRAPTAANYLNLCARYIDNWRYRDAVLACEKSLMQHPDSADAYSKLALAYANQQMWDDAIIAAQRSLQIKPDQPPTRDLLTQALRQKQQKEKASP